MVSLFSETTGYITIGDEYDKKAPADPRNVGLKGFVTQPGKKGNLPWATFGWKLNNEQFCGLNEGDRYRDPGQSEKEAKRNAAEKFVGNGPFKFSSPGKKTNGLGCFYGCFDPHIRHETDYDVIKKGEIPKQRELVPRNILTGPGKRGTYGVPGTLLSNSFGGENADWAGLEYICDPFDNAKKLQLQQQQRDREILSEKVPFKSSSKKKSTFDESHNCGVSLIYKLQKPLPPRKPPPEPPTGQAKDAPWRPNHQGKSGLSSLFGTGELLFPTYREDPYEVKESKEREERIKDKPRFGTWKPVWPTSLFHIAEKTIIKHINEIGIYVEDSVYAFY